MRPDGVDAERARRRHLREAEVLGRAEGTTAVAAPKSRAIAWPAMRPELDRGHRRPRVGRVREVADRVDSLVLQGPERLGIDLDEGIAELRLRQEPRETMRRHQAQEVEAESAHLGLHGAAGRVDGQDARERLVDEDVPVGGHRPEEPGSDRQGRGSGTWVDQRHPPPESTGPEVPGPREGVFVGRGRALVGAFRGADHHMPAAERRDAPAQTRGAMRPIVRAEAHAAPV